MIAGYFVVRTRHSILAEDMLDEAVAIAEESGHYTVVESVVEAVWEDRPECTIEVCKDQAELIIEQGESDRYRHAVQWLRYAGRAAWVAGELNAWRDYVETLGMSITASTSFDRC